MNPRQHRHTTIFIFVLLLITFSCKQDKQKDRICTMMACPSQNARIPFGIERDRYIDEPLYFEKSDLDSFYFIRTDTNNFIPLDSIKIQFGYGSRNGQELYTFYLWEIKTFNPLDLRKYNFLLINRKINFADTITKITYLEKDTTVLCNKCSVPPDDYWDKVLIKDFKYQYNGTEFSVDEFNAQVIRQ